MLKRTFGFALLAATGLGAPAANAVVCNDLVPFHSSGSHEYDSSVTPNSGGVVVTHLLGLPVRDPGEQHCGPWEGNNLGGGSDLNANQGGYGLNVTGDPATGWELGLLGAFSGAGTTSGQFSYADQGYLYYLIVLKADGVFSTFLTGAPSASNWGWNTDVDNNGQYAVSHISIYGTNFEFNCCREDEVPEPGSLALLGLGLLGLGLSRRRLAA